MNLFITSLLWICGLNYNNNSYLASGHRNAVEVLSTQTIKLDTNSNKIKFERDLRWNEIKAKAKAEGKYIFVYVYASWCTLCKKMEKDVYNNYIGDFVNNKFISVKVQIDTSKQDADEIIRWYEDAHQIKDQFRVNAVPTFLFLSPSGNIVHKDIGSKTINLFTEMLSDALNTEKQYFTQIEKYLNGNKDYSIIPYLANTAKKIEEKDVSIRLAQDYIDNYLLLLPELNLYTKQNIDFLNSYIQSSEDKCFNLFYRFSDKIDQVMEQKGFAKGVVDRVITKETINPIIKKAKENGSEPNWKMATKSIKKKFGNDYARRNVLGAQTSWYYNKNWKKFVAVAIKQIETYGIDTTSIFSDGYVNNIAWFGILKHSNSKKQINVGIKWMEAVVRRNPKYSVFLDTYANLLHKAGRSSEAIIAEEQALRYNPNNKQILETLEKIKKNQPTWISSSN